MILKRKIIPMVTAVIKNNGRYLLLQRSWRNKTNVNRWQFPEGKIEFGETPLQGLKRELKEETNSNLKKAKLLGLHSSVFNYHGLSCHLLRILFNCEVSGKIKLSGEHSKFNWFKLKEIEKLDLVEGFEFKELESVVKI